MNIEDKLRFFELLERIAKALENQTPQSDYILEQLHTLQHTVDTLCERTAVVKPDVLHRPPNLKLEVKRPRGQ